MAATPCSWLNVSATEMSLAWPWRAARPFKRATERSVEPALDCRFACIPSLSHCWCTAKLHHQISCILGGGSHGQSKFMRQRTLSKGSTGKQIGSSEHARTSGTQAKIKRSEVEPALLRSIVAELEATRNDPGMGVLQRWLVPLISQGIANADSSPFRLVSSGLPGR